MILFADAFIVLQRITTLFKQFWSEGQIAFHGVFVTLSSYTCDFQSPAFWSWLNNNCPISNPNISDKNVIISMHWFPWITKTSAPFLLRNNYIIFSSTFQVQKCISQPRNIKLWSWLIFQQTQSGYSSVYHTRDVPGISASIKEEVPLEAHWYSLYEESLAESKWHPG